MGKVILVASGKGGVGKSSFCASLGFSLVSKKNKVLLLDLDCGLRSLDIMVGLEVPPIYNVADILNERCEIAKAIVSIENMPLLNLISSPVNSDEIINYDNFGLFFNKIVKHYDYIIIDCGAGMQKGFKKALDFADRVLIITNPDSISVRDAAIVSDYIINKGKSDVRLIINKVNLNTKQNPLTDFDKIIDHVGVQLIGVIPQDNDLSKIITNGNLQDKNDKSYFKLAVDNIAYRILGKATPLLIS